MADQTSLPARDYLIGLVRTGVPYLWGALITWLVGHQVVDTDTAATISQTPTELVLLAITVVSWAYYALIRLAQPYLLRIPLLGAPLVVLLLGSTSTASYSSSGKHALDE